MFPLDNVKSRHKTNNQNITKRPSKTPQKCQVNGHKKNIIELRSIRRMMTFAQLFPDIQIVSRTATQLSWSHFQEVLSIKNDLACEFYISHRKRNNQQNDHEREESLVVVTLRKIVATTARQLSWSQYNPKLPQVVAEFHNPASQIPPYNMPRDKTSIQYEVCPALT